MKTNAYIDGFNLYHSILPFNDNRLKWLNIKFNGETIKIPNEYVKESENATASEKAI